MANTKTNTPLLYTIGINKPQALRLSAYGMVLLFLAASLFSSIIGSAGNSSLNPLIAVFAYLLAMAAHEAIHGVFFRIYGGRPKYGVGLMYHFFPYAYATSPGQPYTLKQMLVIGMSPLIIICGLAVLAAFLIPSITPYAAVVFVGNFAGAIGDMWLVRQILRFKKVKDLVFLDLKNGIAVHGKGSEAKPVIEKMKQLDNPNTPAAKVTKVWITSALVISGVAVFMPVIFALIAFNGHVLIGPSQFPLFEYEATDKTSSYQLGIFPILIGSLVYALLYTFIRRRKSKQVIRINQKGDI
jgi:hypothetical protein